MLTTMTAPTAAYSAAPWSIVDNAFNLSGINYGVNANQTATYDTAHINVGTSFTWNYPAEPANAIQVHAYPNIGYGGGPWGIYEPSSGLSDSINNLSAVTAKFDIMPTGDLAGYDVAFDIFLTTTSGGGLNSVSDELMIWLHTGSFNPLGTVVGNYEDSDFSGKLYVENGAANSSEGYTDSPKYLAYQSNTDDVSGEVDILSMLRNLKALGLISGNEYIASIQLGAEVAYGSGSLSVSSLDLTVSSEANSSLTISGAAASQFSDYQSEINPFGQVRISDPAPQALETVTMTVSDVATGTISNANGMLSGTGLQTVSPGVYSLSGSQKVVTEEIQALVFSPTVGLNHSGVGTSFAIDVNDGSLKAHDASTIISGSDSDPAGLVQPVNVIGTDAAESFFGTAGPDTIIAMGGNDTIEGGSGDDQLYGNTGDDLIFGGSGRDTLYGGKDEDTIIAGTGDTQLYGNLGNDSLTAGAGADTLYGGKGNDVLTAGSGNDTLSGDLGDDTLVGGSGHATFVFGPGSGHDVIKQFIPSTDTIDLSAFVAAGVHGNAVDESDGALLTASTGDTILVLGVHVADLVLQSGWII